MRYRPHPSRPSQANSRHHGIINPAAVEIDVPVKRPAIVRWLLDEMLPAYDRAVVAGDALGQIDALVRINTCRRRYSGTWRDLATALAAPKWQVPLWGQPGTMLLTIAGCGVVASYEGLFGYDGMGTRPSADAAPFYSIPVFSISHGACQTGRSLPLAA
jgi:hypothetical protein